MPHLYLAITAHGYGHLAQVGPVVAALAAYLPGLRVTVHSELPPQVLAAWLPAGFRQLDGAADPGMVMAGPLQVCWAESVAAYEAFLATAPRRLASLRRLFLADPPDLVLADVPWLPLLAARDLDIPAVALSSLNWHDILVEGAGFYRVSPALREHLAAGYRAADLFIRPTPSMPMAWLENARGVGPIARLGRNRAAQLRRQLRLSALTPLVLMQFGGIAAAPQWLRGAPPAGTHWLVPPGSGKTGAGVTPYAALDLPFQDLVASVDLLVTKPGYGSFVEAAGHGLPVLYLGRDDWPETPYLVEWLGRQVPSAAVAAATLGGGELATQVQRLLAAGRSPPVAPTGVVTARDMLLPLLVDDRT